MPLRFTQTRTFWLSGMTLSVTSWVTLLYSVPQA